MSDRALGVLGRGASGDVVLVRRTQRRGGLVAVKTLHRTRTSQESLHRFLREQQLSFDHPHIVRVLDWSSDSESNRLVMAPARWGSVEELLHRNTELPTEIVRDVLAAALDGVAFLHRQGVIHRDLKPANLLLFDDEGSVVVKVGDLGLAVLLEGPRLTEVATVVGTVGYTAPEVVRGDDADEAADLFSLGVTFLEVLETCPDAPESWRAAAVEMMSAAPDQRRPAADRLRSELGALPPAAADRWRAVELSSVFDQLVRRDRRRRGLTAVAVGAVGASLAAIATFGPWPREPRPSGTVRYLEADPIEEGDDVRDAVTMAALAYELADTRDPVLVRMAFIQNLEGTNPCSTFVACRELIRAGKPIRFVGHLALTPVDQATGVAASQRFTIRSGRSGGRRPLAEMGRYSCTLVYRRGSFDSALEGVRSGWSKPSTCLAERSGIRRRDSHRISTAQPGPESFTKARVNWDVLEQLDADHAIGYGEMIGAGPATVSVRLGRCLNSSVDRAQMVARATIESINREGGVLGGTMMLHEPDDGSGEGGDYTGYIADVQVVPYLCDGAFQDRAPVRPTLVIQLADFLSVSMNGPPWFLTSDFQDRDSGKPTNLAQWSDRFGGGLPAYPPSYRVNFPYCAMPGTPPAVEDCRDGRNVQPSFLANALALRLGEVEGASDVFIDLTMFDSTRTPTKPGTWQNRSTSFPKCPDLRHLVPQTATVRVTLMCSPRERDRARQRVRQGSAADALWLVAGQTERARDEGVAYLHRANADLDRVIVVPVRNTLASAATAR